MSATVPLPPSSTTSRSADKIAALRAAARRHLAAVRAYGLLDEREGDADPLPAADLLERIADQDTSGLTAVGWLDRLQALVRVEAYVDALKAATIAAFDDVTRGISADLGHEQPEPGDRLSEPTERRWHGGLLRSVSDEIGLVLQIHRGAANVRIAQSWELTHNHPRILAALSDGTLTERAAFTLVDELATLTDQTQLRDAETTLLDWATKHPLQRVKQAARREVVRRDAAAVDKIRTRTLADRSIRMISDNCGAAELISTHDAVHAAAAMTSLTNAALRLRRAGDERTLDQLRADIALSRMLGIPDDAADGGVGGSADVVIHASADEVEAILGRLPSSGGELAGHGPLPQGALADALAGKSGPLRTSLRWRVLDRPPTSDPARYQPPAALDRWIRWRDRRCRFPGCNRPAAHCDLDHRDPFDPTAPNGGRTTAANLHALCRHHHRLKHDGGWTIRRNPDNTTTWTSPTKREYLDNPTDDP